MDNISYYFLDDQLNQESLISDFDEASGVSVEFHQISEDWDADMSIIIEAISNESIDGILFDWQLHDKNTGYDSEALTQQIKRVIIQQHLKDIPFILCSAADDFPTIYKENFTSHDLFDKYFHKNEFSDNSEGIIRIFKSLAIGYRQIRENIENISEIIKINECDLMYVSSGFVEFLSNGLKSKVIHRVSNILLNNFIIDDGIIINEKTLATRLGICSSHVDNQDKQWGYLKEILNKTKYRGVFYEGWDRWWMYKIQHWWDNSFSGVSLRRTVAEQKVKMLLDKFELQFNPISYNEKHPSKYYWVNCVQTQIPIDTVDGLLIANQAKTAPWIDKKYLSIEAITDTSANNEYEVDISFKNKEKLFKDKYDNSQERIKR